MGEFRESSEKTAWGTNRDEHVARRLLESLSSHAVFMIDREGTILEWPGCAEKLYGYDAETMLGEHVSTLFAEKDGTKAGEPPDGFLDGPNDGTIAVEHWQERADGSVFWATLTLSSLAGTSTSGWAVVGRDKTPSKEYERMLERQNDRLKEFTDILAHDLRNPLQAIDGHLHLYEETGESTHIEAIDQTTDRMGRLVDDLLRVARQGDVVTDPEPTDIGTVVDTAWQAVGASSDVALRYHDIPSVNGDADRLCELFENLFRNAVEHSSTRPHSSSTREDAVEHGLRAARDAPAVTIHVGPLETGFYVADDGPGIPDSVKDDIFDHGFTTAPGGSGYGLSVVRTIVNAHGWDILVTDAESGGARFEITGIDFLQ